VVNRLSISSLGSDQSSKFSTNLEYFLCARATLAKRVMVRAQSLTVQKQPPLFIFLVNAL
jgi:hypothetical protein